MTCGFVMYLTFLNDEIYIFALIKKHPIATQRNCDTSKQSMYVAKL